jgi:hypothetical protein
MAITAEPLGTQICFRMVIGLDVSVDRPLMITIGLNNLSSYRGLYLRAELLNRAADLAVVADSAGAPLTLIRHLEFLSLGSPFAGRARAKSDLDLIGLNTALAGPRGTVCLVEHFEFWLELQPLLSDCYFSSVLLLASYLLVIWGLRVALCVTHPISHRRKHATR